jgi:hypothetical protein
MTTGKKWVFMLFGVVTKCCLRNSLWKNLLSLEYRLTYFGVYRLPAVITLSDADISMNSQVFASIYQHLLLYFREELRPVASSFLDGQFDDSRVTLLNTSIISFFVDVFKGAGYNPMTGKLKGG